MLSFIFEVLFNKRLKLPPGFSCFISCSVTVIVYNLDLQKNKNSLVPGRMSDMSIKGPEFWIRAWWCRDTPVQKFWGFTDWLNSVSVTGTAALSSPVASKR